MLVGHFVVGILVFTLSYVAIISEKLNRMIVAVFGATLMILFHVISQEDALAKIDFNTLGLLIGMMIIVNIIKTTGLFQYLAILTAKIAKGNPKLILIYFAIITAVSSALLDNVTTILLIVPVTLVISDTLKINPLPFIIAEIMSANIFGAATLIGSPPSIMIGGATGYSFGDFIMNMLPIMTVIIIVTISLILFIFRKAFTVAEKDKKEILSFDENKAITNSKLLKKSLFVLFLTIFGFTIAEISNYRFIWCIITVNH